MGRLLWFCCEVQRPAGAADWCDEGFIRSGYLFNLVLEEMLY